MLTYTLFSLVALVMLYMAWVISAPRPHTRLRRLLARHPVGRPRGKRQVRVAVLLCLPVLVIAGCCTPTSPSPCMAHSSYLGRSVPCADVDMLEEIQRLRDALPRGPVGDVVLPVPCTTDADCHAKNPGLCLEGEAYCF